jgi:hypothetical protein
MQTWTYSNPTLLFWPRRLPVTGLVEAGQLLDVEVDEIAGAAPLVAPDRRLGLDGRELAEAEAGQLGRDRGAGEPEPAGDLGRGQPAVPQPEDHLAPARAHPPGAAQRPRGAVEQTGGTFRALAGAPFAHRPDADAKAGGRSRSRPAAVEAGDQKGSTVGVGPRILVAVHSDPPGQCRPRNPHSRAADPGEQPPWITHLGRWQRDVGSNSASPARNG